MIRNVLEHIGGVDRYGVISICLFFAFFVGMLVWVARLKKPHLDAMSGLPLEDAEATRPISDQNGNPDNHHE
jgi:hypothetical protein